MESSKSTIMDGIGSPRLASCLGDREITGAGHCIWRIQRRGVPRANRRGQIADSKSIARRFGFSHPLYRNRPSTVGANPVVNRTDLPVDVDGARPSDDDVLYTGRTIRARRPVSDFGSRAGAARRPRRRGKARGSFRFRRTSSASSCLRRRARSSRSCSTTSTAKRESRLSSDPRHHLKGRRRRPAVAAFFLREEWAESSDED